MRDQIKLLLKYNQSENKVILRILEGLSEEERVADRKSYYTSLHGLTDHIALVQVLYENAILANFTRISEIKAKPLNAKIDFKAINYKDFAELKSVLEKADEECNEILNILSDECKIDFFVKWLSIQFYFPAHTY